MDMHSRQAFQRNRQTLLIITVVYTIFGGLSFTLFHESLKTSFPSLPTVLFRIYLIDAAYFCLTVVLVVLLVCYLLRFIQRYEDALQESEERYRSLASSMENAAREWRTTFDAMCDSVALLTVDGTVIRANRATLAMLETSFDELLDQPISRFVHGTPATHPEYPFERMTISLRRESDVVPLHDRWYMITIDPLLDEDGNLTGAIHIMRDITERKQADDQIRTYQEQLVSLASELSLAEERERRRIATGLHDHISQALAISNMKLGALRESIASVPSSVAQIDEIREMIIHAYEDCQSLTFDLSPPMLYNLGLQATLEWLAEQMQNRYDIVIAVEGDEEPTRFEDEIAAVLYRTVRELLINIVKHACAKRATISLVHVGDTVQIVVADDGVGFDPMAIRGNTGEGAGGGFGLFSIREHLKYFSGRMEIHSTPGEGTHVELTLPCSRSMAITHA